MKQVFWSEPLAVGQTIALEDKIAHHLFDVLRTTSKEFIRLVDKSHRVFLAQVTTKPYLKVVEELPLHATPTLEITLCAALIKADKFEWLLQKAAELGATRIVPFMSTNTVIQLEDKKIERKMARWESILEGACRQSNRLSLVQLERPCRLNELVQYKSAINVCAWEKEHQSHPLCLALEKLDAAHTSVTFVIGPEGGFTPQEALKLEEVGFEPCSLGPRILRAETAACYVLACTDYAWSQANLGNETGKETHFEVL